MTVQVRNKWGVIWRHLTLNDLDISLKVLKELYPDAAGMPYMFFDEIQEIPKWELFIKRIVERESVLVYITGSSIAGLRKEMFPGRDIYQGISSAIVSWILLSFWKRSTQK